VAGVYDVCISKRVDNGLRHQSTLRGGGDRCAMIARLKGRR